jgi:hypothetical protein
VGGLYTAIATGWPLLFFREDVSPALAILGVVVWALIVPLVVVWGWRPGGWRRRRFEEQGRRAERWGLAPDTGQARAGAPPLQGPGLRP